MEAGRPIRANSAVRPLVEDLVKECLGPLGERWAPLLWGPHPQETVRQLLVEVPLLEEWVRHRRTTRLLLPPQSGSHSSGAGEVMYYGKQVRMGQRGSRVQPRERGGLRSLQPWWLSPRAAGSRAEGPLEQRAC